MRSCAMSGCNFGGCFENLAQNVLFYRGLQLSLAVIYV